MRANNNGTNLFDKIVDLLNAEELDTVRRTTD